MRFVRRRGRPCQNKPAQDKGTPELRAKRAAGVTLEPVDLCFEKTLINDAQHKAARRLLWLYRMRHGSPWVKAIDWDAEGASAYHPEDSDAWHALREEELAGALETLERERCKKTVLDVCVFQKMPSFLFSYGCKTRREYQELEQLRHGLDVLVDYWKRRGGGQGARPSSG